MAPYNVWTVLSDKIGQTTRDYANATQQGEENRLRREAARQGQEEFGFRKQEAAANRNFAEREFASRQEENLFVRQAREITQEMEAKRLKILQDQADREQAEYEAGRQALLDMDQTNQRLAEIESQYNEMIAGSTQPAVIANDLVTGEPQELSPATTTPASPEQLQQADVWRKSQLRQTLGTTTRTARVGPVTVTQPSYQDLISDEATANWRESRASGTTMNMDYNDFMKQYNSDPNFAKSVTDVTVKNGVVTYKFVPAGSLGEEQAQSVIDARNSSTVIHNAANDRANVELAMKAYEVLNGHGEMNQVTADWLGSVMSENPNLSAFVDENHRITRDGWAQIASGNATIRGAVSSVSPELRQQAATYLRDRYPDNPAKLELARILENTNLPVPSSVYGTLGTTLRDHELYNAYVKPLREANEGLYKEVRLLADGVTTGAPGAGLSTEVRDRLARTYGISPSEVTQYYNALLNRNTATDYEKLALTKARLQLSNVYRVRIATTPLMQTGEGVLSPESQMGVQNAASQIYNLFSSAEWINGGMANIIAQNNPQLNADITSLYARMNAGAYNKPKMEINDAVLLNRVIDGLNMFAPTPSFDTMGPNLPMPTNMPSSVPLATVPDATRGGGVARTTEVPNPQTMYPSAVNQQTQGALPTVTTTAPQGGQPAYQPPPQSQSQAQPQEQPQAQQVYVVRSGDSLSKIAQTYLGDMNRWRELAQINGIQNPNQISVGQQIVIPGGAPMSAQPERSAQPTYAPQAQYQQIPSTRELATRIQKMYPGTSQEDAITAAREGAPLLYNLEQGLGY